MAVAVKVKLSIASNTVKQGHDLPPLMLERPGTVVPKPRVENVAVCNRYKLLLSEIVCNTDLNLSRYVKHPEFHWLIQGITGDKIIKAIPTIITHSSW